jgi:hypothetical protein
MAMREVFRYSWIKVTDEDGRAQMMRAALALQTSLSERARATQPDNAEAQFLRTQMLMARVYLGGDVEHVIRVIIFSPAEAGSLALDLATPLPHQRSENGIEIATATMPSGYTLAQAQAWLETPVGVAWSTGALACRLAHAVVNTEVSRPASLSADQHEVA